jgi:hypothetical protein
MIEPTTPLSRRVFLTVGAGLSVGALSLAQDSRPTETNDSEPLVVYAVRHAEKGAEGGRDPALSPGGSARAVELARVLSDVPLDAVYSTNTTRTRSTAQPVAEAKGLEIKPYAPGQLAARLVAGTARCVLVVGHSNTVPVLLSGLGATFEPKLLEGNDDLFLALRAGSPPVLQHLHYGAAKKAESPAAH